jgi:hypothetical protein
MISGVEEGKWCCESEVYRRSNESRVLCCWGGKGNSGYTMRQEDGCAANVSEMLEVTLQ